MVYHDETPVGTPEQSEVAATSKTLGSLSVRYLQRNPQIEILTTSQIRTDGGTQPRAGLNQEVLEEYSEAMTKGAFFPPVVVFHDGESYWLADGYHRLEATKKTGAATIPADVRQGTRRDAVLYSVGANATHGLRRSNADKRRAVLTLLSDAEWCQWSNSEIARHCGVDEGLIRKLKDDLSSDSPRIDRKFAQKCGVTEDTLKEAQQKINSLPQERRARRNGKIYTINTEKISKNGKANGVEETSKASSNPPFESGTEFPEETTATEQQVDGNFAELAQNSETLSESEESELPAAENQTESAQLIVSAATSLQDEYQIDKPYFEQELDEMELMQDDIDMEEAEYKTEKTLQFGQEAEQQEQQVNIAQPTEMLEVAEEAALEPVIESLQEKDNGEERTALITDFDDSTVVIEAANDIHQNLENLETSLDDFTSRQENGDESPRSLSQRFWRFLASEGMEYSYKSLNPKFAEVDEVVNKIAYAIKFKDLFLEDPLTKVEFQELCEAIDEVVPFDWVADWFRNHPRLNSH